MHKTPTDTGPVVSVCRAWLKAFASYQWVCRESERSAALSVFASPNENN